MIYFESFLVVSSLILASQYLAYCASRKNKSAQGNGLMTELPLIKLSEDIDSFMTGFAKGCNKMQ